MLAPMRTPATIFTATLLAAVCVMDGGAHASGFVSDPGCPYRVAAAGDGRDKIDVTRLFKDADLVVVGTVVKNTVQDKKAGAGVLTVRIAARVKGVDDAETYDTYLTSSEPVQTKTAPVWVVPGILLVLTSMLALLGGVLGRGSRPALAPVKASNEGDEPTDS